MRRMMPVSVAVIPFAALLLCFAGCNGANEGNTGAEQLEAEREDVQEAQEKLKEARGEIGEQKEELQDAREDVAEQTRELEQAEDAVGDAERQLAKEKADLEAERTDADQVPKPQ